MEEEPMDEGLAGNHEDHQVPPELLELFEVMEYERLSKSSPGPRSTAQGNIVTRSQWGAKNPTRVNKDIHPGNGGVAWHWEGPKMGPFPHTSCATKVRGIQNYHMSQGWSDVAYTAIYCPHGYIFVCRWWNVRTAANGTNAGNESWYAACYLGGEGDPFTDDGKAAARLFRSLATHDGGAAKRNEPHDYFKATACPGPQIRQYIPTLGSNPPPNPEEMLVRVKEHRGFCFLPNGDLVIANREGGLFFFDADGQADQYEWVDAYNVHPEWWGGATPTAHRECIGLKADGDHVIEIFDDGSTYRIRAAH